MFVNKFFTYLAHNSKSKSCFNVKSSTSYFHMNAKILAYFQICIRVPLILHLPQRSDFIFTEAAHQRCS